ncbi:hypothetical protein BDP27DRAFT_1369682 [Rhodocollybia butyracea]|uniref:Uncharacterized protein n=1 Tax=Rhodocollybia butyracea TaxID=206335 RepID=A0A9P5PDX8_9AGAR|nr:hypothetical protein BDP27DRAFT_1369682 [Rhodocollybia butyracea]
MWVLPWSRTKGNMEPLKLLFVIFKQDQGVDALSFGRASISVVEDFERDRNQDDTSALRKLLEYVGLEKIATRPGRIRSTNEQKLEQRRRANLQRALSLCNIFTSSSFSGAIAAGIVFPVPLPKGSEYESDMDVDVPDEDNSRTPCPSFKGEEELLALVETRFMAPSIGTSEVKKDRLHIHASLKFTASWIPRWSVAGVFLLCQRL